MKTLYIFLLFLPFISVSGQLKEADVQFTGCGSYFFSYSFPTGKLANYFPVYFGMGVNLEFRYKDFVLDISKIGSQLKDLKSDFYFNGNWIKNTPTKLSFYEVLIGHTIINNGTFVISPVIGAEIPKIVASSGYIHDNSQYGDMSIYGFSPEIGWNIELATKPGELFKNKNTKRMKYYLHTRLQLVYEFTNFDSTTPELKGGFFKVQFGAGITAKRFKKDSPKKKAILK